MRPSRIPPGPGQESVWDYPRPPAVEAVAQRIRVVLAGVTVDGERLQASSRRSFCEFKGLAHYWSVVVGDRVEHDAAWSYPEPSPGYEALTDHLAFYAAGMDECRVGDERATPQPGGFYGGWVTSGVVGPFKGVPGSLRW